MSQTALLQLVRKKYPKRDIPTVSPMPAAIGFNELRREDVPGVRQLRPGDLR